MDIELSEFYGGSNQAEFVDFRGDFSQVKRPKYPSIPAEELRVLIIAARDGDREALTRILQSQDENIYKVAGKTYKGMKRDAAFDVDDLASIVKMGMIRAIRSYHPEKTLNVTGYLVSKGKYFLIDTLRQNAGLIRTPRRAIEDIKVFTKVSIELSQQLMREPTDEEIQDVMGMSAKKFRKLKGIIGGGVLSLDDEADSESGHGGTLHEVVPDMNVPMPGDNLLRAELLSIVKHAIKRLTPVQQEILTLHFMDDLKLKEIGHIRNVTESRICQISRATIDALRVYVHHMTQDHPFYSVLFRRAQEGKALNHTAHSGDLTFKPFEMAL